MFFSIDYFYQVGTIWLDTSTVQLVLRPAQVYRHFKKETIENDMSTDMFTCEHSSEYGFDLATEIPDFRQDCLAPCLLSDNPTVPLSVSNMTSNTSKQSQHIATPKTLGAVQSCWQAVCQCFSCTQWSRIFSVYIAHNLGFHIQKMSEIDCSQSGKGPQTLK